MSFRKVFLVRHGQTDWNALGLWQGHDGPGLNQTGREQAESAARRLANTDITALFSSDLPRALETAGIISASIGLNPIELTGLRERNCGDWSGKSSEQIRSENPGIDLKIGIDTLQDPAGMESWDSFRMRVVETLKQVLMQGRGNIAVVTHGGVIYSILSYIDPVTHFRIPGNANITVLLDNGRLSVEALSF